MLVQFSTANFLSFKEKTTLNLIASSITEFQDSNVFATPLTDVRLLKSLVIYGPNASGKSNMFKALNFMRWFVMNSAKDLQASEEIEVQSFKFNTATIQEASLFEIEIIIEERKYRYGFKADDKLIHEEWLFQTKKIKEYPLFHRIRQDIKIEERFDASEEVKKLTRDSALFISVAAQFNSKIAAAIIRKMKSFKFVSGVRDEMHIDQTVRMLEDKKYAKLIKDLILSAELGFTDIKTEKINLTEEMLTKSGIPMELRSYILKDGKGEKFQVSTIHQVYDENNNPTDTTFLNLMSNESLGTQKFFSLAGPIIDSIINGGTLIVDEFSSKMNPLLCESIIKLFNSATNNPFNAQFLFVTHNTQFINKNSNIFRRDQMLLFKKDKYGASQIKSLYDLRVRKDASFDKEYLNEMYETPLSIDLSNQLSQLSLFNNDILN